MVNWQEPETPCTLFQGEIFSSADPVSLGLTDRMETSEIDVAA